MLPSRIAERLYWAAEAFRGRSAIRRRLAWLTETQWLTSDELRELQLLKLRRIVQHAFETVPYYRRVMRECGFNPYAFDDPTQLAALPLLTRTTLREQQSDLLSTAVSRKLIQTNFSSGSTGVRAEFVQDREHTLWSRAHQLRTYGWCGGWRPGDRFLLLWGSPVYWQMRSATQAVVNALSNRREIDAYRLDPDNVQRMLDAMLRFRPRLVSAYTTALLLVARRAQREGHVFPWLRAVQPTAEPLSPGVRDVLGDAFGCEVFDKYGSRETNIVAHESPRHEELCMQAENAYVEILDDAQRPCTFGQTGTLVVTTLNNDAMPLIRYVTSDQAARLDGTCSSGVGFERMTAVSGRLHDVLVTPEGTLIHPQLFSNLFMREAAIDWFRVVQETVDALDVEVLAPRGLPDDTRRALRRRIAELGGHSFAIRWHLLDRMPHSPTGKFQLCQSEPGARARASVLGVA